MFWLISLLIASSNAYVFNPEECLNYTVYPVQYELRIYPYIYTDRSFYDCYMTITVIANAPGIQIIELDAKEIDIQGSIQVFDGNTDIVNQYRPFEYDKDSRKLYIHLNEPLKVYKQYGTQYLVKLLFKKIVRDNSEGIFIVEYEDNGPKYMMTTRLSPNKAKYFFPCIDNPQLESVFKVKVELLTERNGLQKTNTSLVISNKINEHGNQNKYITVEYMPSPQIFTHQFGFHASQFGHSEVKIKSTNDSLVIWAPVRSLGDYSFILTFGETMVNIIREYSLNNRTLVNGGINIVAVPNTMESYEADSWNLWTIGDYRLAYNPKQISIKQIKRMMFKFTEQLCRVWLGNPGETIRTRWNEQWFKEGMATYFAHHFLDQYYYRRTTDKMYLGSSGIEIKNEAMMIEDWNNDIPELIAFDDSIAKIPSRHVTLARLKTASLMRMVENWVGTMKFHETLVKYINSRRDQASWFISLQDLLNFLDMKTVECQNQLFEGYSASGILDSWLRRRGYPVINVNILRDRIPNAIQLKQKKFSLTEKPEDSDFFIPISYIVQNNENCLNCYKKPINIRMQTYTFEEYLNNGWIILNRNATGYYRVNYDDFTWNLIAKTLKENHEAIEEMNRAQIVNDVFALYTAGELSYEKSTNILDYLDKETSYTVWYSTIDGFELMKKVDARCNMNKYMYEDWKNFMRFKIGPIYNNLSIDKLHSSRMFRSRIYEFASLINYENCKNYLRQVFRIQRYNLNPDLREACFSTIYNDTHSIGRVDNRFEIEDKLTAEYNVQQENHFLYRIPQGSPPAQLLSTSTEALILTSTQPPRIKKAVPGSAAYHTSLLPVTIFVAIFISNCLS